MSGRRVRWLKSVVFPIVTRDVRNPRLLQPMWRELKRVYKPGLSIPQLVAAARAKFGFGS